MKEGGGHLRLGGIGRHDGAEGGAIEGGVGVQRGHAYCQVSGAEADGRTFKLQLVDQLVHCPQSSDVERRGDAESELQQVVQRDISAERLHSATYVPEVLLSSDVWELLITLEMMVTTVEASELLILATSTSCFTLLTTLDTCRAEEERRRRGGEGGVISC